MPVGNDDTIDDTIVDFLGYPILGYSWNNPQLEALGVEGSRMFPRFAPSGFLSFAEPSDLGIQKSPFRIPIPWLFFGCDSNPQSYCRNGTEKTWGYAFCLWTLVAELTTHRHTQHTEKNHSSSEVPHATLERLKQDPMVNIK